MSNLTHYPLLVFIISFVVLWLASILGKYFRQRQRDLDKDLHADFGIILAATLTLLGLIIGFSFSMATNRYDMRRNFEEAEANAIGTEYVRVDLLPTADAAELRPLLRSYLDQRIAFYLIHDDEQKIQRINNSWEAVVTLNYDFTKRFTLKAGYRALGLNTYNLTGQGDVWANLILQGAIIGLEFHF
jgi:hypothetical protein